MPEDTEITSPLTANDGSQDIAPRRRGRPATRGREAMREPSRGGRVEVRGRDGEVLTRKRTTNNDLFYIAPNLIPEGWDYQWNVVEVMGQPQTAAQIGMAENGWRPVPAGRHKGMFMPANYPENGEIVRDGLRLEERPLALTEEARREELQRANAQMRDTLEMHGLAQKMPDGFSRRNPNLTRWERSSTSRSYGPAPDIDQPSYEIDPDS